MMRNNAAGFVNQQQFWLGKTEEIKQQAGAGRKVVKCIFLSWKLKKEIRAGLFPVLSQKHCDADFEFRRNWNRNNGKLLHLLY